jgi:TrmH family RNA methyltransferase
MQLTSTKNPLVQSNRKAAASGRTTEDGFSVVEGPHLVQELLLSRWGVEQILVTPASRDRHAALLSKTRVEITELPAKTFASISGTEASQEILALASAPRHTWQDCLTASGLAVILDGIQDPGNAGTIVRSAEAFGAACVIFLEGSVRVSNGKFLRATAGSIFRLPHLENQTRAAMMTNLRAQGWPLYALTARGELSIGQADLRQPAGLIVGSEARGVSAELLACSKELSIPTLQVESLNAGVACSLALYEAARQRGQR